MNHRKYFNGTADKLHAQYESGSTGERGHGN